MKYPSLVLERFCKTPVKVIAEQEGLDKYGESLDNFEYEGFCNYQDKGKTVLTAEKKLIQLSGVALFTGDIFPELSVITSGEIIIHGCSRRIYEGTKARNPDGTVNYTRLDVM
jgi:hypothetical protein